MGDSTDLTSHLQAAVEERCEQTLLWPTLMTNKQRRPKLLLFTHIKKFRQHTHKHTPNFACRQSDYNTQTAIIRIYDVFNNSMNRKGQKRQWYQDHISATLLHDTRLKLSAFENNTCAHIEIMPIIH